jgi:hypothetical protein
MKKNVHSLILLRVQCIVNKHKKHIKCNNKITKITWSSFLWMEVNI